MQPTQTRRCPLLASLLLLFLATPLLIGCGGGDYPRTVPVSGKVTIDGKTPPGPGTVYFAPKETFVQEHTRPTSAPFDAGGNYTASAYRDVTGLVPGRYQIGVECWETRPGLDTEARSHIPQRFANTATSGLELTVNVDDRAITHNIDVVTTAEQD